MDRFEKERLGRAMNVRELQRGAAVAVASAADSLGLGASARPHAENARTGSRLELAWRI